MKFGTVMGLGNLVIADDIFLQTAMTPGASRLGAMAHQNIDEDGHHPLYVMTILLNPSYKAFKAWNRFLLLAENKINCN